MVVTSSRRGLAFVIAASALVASGLALAEGLHVKDAWSRATPPGASIGAAYFKLESDGKGDRLVGVSTTIAKKSELHVTLMENGMMRMRPLETVEVKKGSPVAFEPGGRHVMLMGLKKPLKAGERFPLVLKFASGSTVEVQVEVRDGRTTAEHSGMGSMGSQSGQSMKH